MEFLTDLQDEQTLLITTDGEILAKFIFFAETNDLNPLLLTVHIPV